VVHKSKGNRLLSVSAISYRGLPKPPSSRTSSSSLDRLSASSLVRRSHHRSKALCKSYTLLVLDFKTVTDISLSTLTVLLEEVPQLVRPFHPQLTRTFVKSASDPAALSVRNRAAAGLGELMKHQVGTSTLLCTRSRRINFPYWC
jgi:hypothetical protein